MFADGGESYSIRNTKGIPYQKQIDAFYDGDSKTVGRSDDIYIADADNSLSSLGIGEKPFFMLKSNLRKSTRVAGNNPSNSAHGISESIIRKLPEFIKSPALIVQGDGRISIIPGITVKTEKNNTAPLLIAVNPNGSVDGIDAYEIKSIYGRENFANWLDLRARDSKIIAGDGKKAAALLRDVGKQYPEPVAYAADLTDAILSQSKGDVKSPTLGDEIRRQIMGTEAESLPGEFGYKAERLKDYRLGDTIPNVHENVKYSAFNEEVARQLAGEDRGKVKFSAEDTTENPTDDPDIRYSLTQATEGRKMNSRARRDVNQTMNAVQTELRGLIEAETRAARDTQKQVLSELAQTALDGKNISQEQINDAFETVWNAGRVVDRSAGEAAWDVKEYLRTQGVALSEADQALTARRRRCSI